jgi:WD40 repeat protein
VAFSPNGKQVVSGSVDGTMRFWDAATGAALLQPLKAHTGSVMSLAFSPNGKQVVSGSDNKVRLLDTVTGVTPRTLKGHLDSVRSVAISPDSKQVASGTWDETVRLWDTRTGVILQILEGPRSASSVAFSSDSKLEPTLFVTSDWVVEGGINILWLPPDYRVICQAVQNKVIALGHSSGRVSVLSFEDGKHLIELIV